MKKAIVTGGAGFIGSHVVDALLEKAYEVLVIDDFSTGVEGNLESAEESHGAQLSVWRGDICADKTLEKVVEFAPEIIFHHAAQMNVRRSVAEPTFDAEKNVIGTVNMLEAARAAGTKTFILASTGGAIYGEQDEFPAGEDHRTSPECPYGVSKRSGELYLEYYSRKHDIRTVALRYSNVYGPRQNPKGEAGVVAIFCERLIAGDTLLVNGDGEQTRDFVYVGDVVRANVLAAETDAERGYYVYNVGTGEESTITNIVEYLGDVWASNKPEGAAEMSVEHGPELPGEQRRSVISAAKLAKEFGWTADMSLKDGLEKTIRSYRARS